MLALSRLLFIAFCFFPLSYSSADEDWDYPDPEIDEAVKSLEGHCLYDFAVMSLFQNEERFLKEWVEYYLLMGAKHFFMYNNDSTDNYMDILQPYIDRGLITLYDWPTPSGGNFNQVQTTALDHCVNVNRGTSKWLALIDTDEFIFPLNKPDIVSFLADFERWGSVYIRWEMFGTSYVYHVPDDKLLIDLLDHRGLFQPGKNWLGKCIVKPHLVKRPGVHTSTLYAPYRMCDTNPGSNEEYPEIRINHYWSRDEDFLLNVKKPRREEYEGRVWTDEETAVRKRMYNDVQDRLMERFIPAMYERVFA